MSDSNRRTFLAASGAGAAAGVVALTGLAPAAEASPNSDSGETKRRANSAHETVVAYVEDHNSSKLSLMVGEREVVVHDRDLVHRILNAAGGE